MSEPVLLSTENIEQVMEWMSGIIPTDVYQAAYAELGALQAEINRLTNAGLDAAYGETMKTDEASDWFNLATEQRERLIRLHSENIELRLQYNKMQWELNRQIAELRAKLETPMFPKMESMQ